MTTHGSPEQPEQLQPEGGQNSRGPFGISTRWLIIGGGAGGILLIIIVVVVIALSGAIGGGNPQPTSILDLVPDEAHIVKLTDLQQVLASDLMQDLFREDVVWEFTDEIGIDPDDLSETAVAHWDGGTVSVYRANFDPDYIREELEDQDAEENSYRGYAVWESTDGSAIALLESYLVTSASVKSVETVLKNLYNSSGSLARADADNEMKQILDKVGSGFLVDGATGDMCWVERCEGYGWAITEVDESDEEARVEIAILFRNERAAERAADDYDEVADFLEQQGLDIEDTEADGSFVVGVAIQDLEDEDRGADISRANWVEDCDRNSPDPAADHEVCSCIYDHLKASLDRVPEYDPRWDLGFAPPDVVRAGRQCY